MRISIILCTRNRGDRLAGTLRSYDELALQEPSRFELIIVDNGSTDRTLEVVQQWISETAWTTRYVTCPTPGLAHAINCGFDVAQGDIVLLADDDCYFAPDYLARLVQVYESDAAGELGFVTGRILLFDESDERITVNYSNEPRAFPPFSLLRPGEVHGANLSFRAAAGRAIGGFDGRFANPSSIPAGNDLEFCARILASGHSGRYDPGLVVYHHHGRKTQDLAPLLWAYGIGRGAYFAKMFLRSGYRASALRAFAGSIRAHRSWSSFVAETWGALSYLYMSARSQPTEP